MTLIAIIYHSEKGRTSDIAGEIAKGVETINGAKAELLPVTDLMDFDLLEKCDALVFGCPTYMGSASARFKTFMDASSEAWMQQRWKNKIAAGFTNSYAYSGDKLNVLVQLAVFAAQHGMIWVGNAEMQTGPMPQDINRLGSFLGLMTQSDAKVDPVVPPEGDRQTARLFGQRIAEATSRFLAGKQS